MASKPFPQIVKEDSWSAAVSIASNEISHYRPQLFESLKSKDPEIRSAAVTAFNEADDKTAHDHVLKLIDDPDDGVRMEVIEYLWDLGEDADIPIIFERLQIDKQFVSMLSMAISNITGNIHCIISDENAPEVIEKGITELQTYLSENGYI